MNVLPLLCIGVGGSLGALCRYSAALWAGEKIGTGFPWGTACVNLLGAFLLGVLHGAGFGSLWQGMLGTGFMGGLTTFSTWMWETQRLVEDGEMGKAAINAGLPLIFGVLLYGIGRSLGKGVGIC